MIKTLSIQSLTLALTSSLCVACAQAESAVEFACKAPSEINDEQFKDLVTLGTQLANNQSKLELPYNCAENVKVADKTVSNPYRLALQVAAQQKSPGDLAAALAEQQTPNMPLDQKAQLHSEWLRNIKVACGDYLACVKQTINAIPNFSVAESPIFCAFTRMADYSVQMHFQQQPKPSYPVACLGNSALTAGAGLSPMQDWFEAYKLLGK